MSAILAQVARTARDQAWMRMSYSVNSAGEIRHLCEAQGYCCAWAAECLAHTYEPKAGPNRRHSQRQFSYVYASAHAWARALRAGGDTDRGAWMDGDQRPHLRPGDMVFWMQGVNGYRGADGHVAIVTDLDGGVTVSENSSVRGIGTHRISQAALATMAGVMRWRVGEEPRPLLAQLATGNQAVPFWMEGGRAVCNVRELAELLGYEAHAQHLQTQGKIYLVRR